MEHHRSSSVSHLPNLAQLLFFDSDISQSFRPISIEYFVSKKGLHLKKPTQLKPKSNSSFILKQKKNNQVPPTLDFDKPKNQDPKKMFKTLNLKLDFSTKPSASELRKELPKLYTESLHKKYSKKISELKERCLALNTNEVNKSHGLDCSSSLKDLISKTTEQINHTYSIKHLSAEEDGISILSRRVPINKITKKNIRSGSTSSIMSSFIGKEDNEIVYQCKKRFHDLRNPHLEKIEKGKINLPITIIQETRTLVEETQSRLRTGTRIHIEENEETPKELLDPKEKFQESPKSPQIFRKYSDLSKEGLKFQKNDNCRINEIKGAEASNYNTEEDYSRSGQPTLSDESNIIDGSIYVMNKFAVPYNPSMVPKPKKETREKKSKRVNKNFEKLTLAFEKQTNQSSFQRHVAGLNKLKAMMTKTRDKKSIMRNASCTGFGIEFPNKPLIVNRLAPNINGRSSYAGLLKTIHSQENMEPDSSITMKLKQNNSRSLLENIKTENSIEEITGKKLSIDSFVGTQFQGMSMVTKRNKKRFSQSCDDNPDLVNDRKYQRKSQPSIPETMQRDIDSRGNYLYGRFLKIKEGCDRIKQLLE